MQGFTSFCVYCVQGVHRRHAVLGGDGDGPGRVECRAARQSRRQRAARVRHHAYKALTAPLARRHPPPHPPQAPYSTESLRAWYLKLLLPRPYTLFCNIKSLVIAIGFRIGLLKGCEEKNRVMRKCKVDTFFFST